MTVKGKANAAIERAKREKLELAKKYGVSTSAIVWLGDSRYIIVKSGREIKVWR